VCCKNYTEHMNTLCGRNTEMLVLSLAVPIITTGLYGVNQVFLYNKVNLNLLIIFR